MQAAYDLTKSLPVHVFEECVVCCRTRTLRRDGAVVPLEPKAFNLLCYLIEHSDRAVPHRELYAVLWPDVVVSPGALTRLIKEVRRAIGDDGRSQNMVRTLHRYGYQFVGMPRASTRVAPSAAREQQDLVIPLALPTIRISVREA